jgi:hypothetical protein
MARWPGEESAAVARAARGEERVGAVTAPEDLTAWA